MKRLFFTFLLLSISVQAETITSSSQSHNEEYTKPKKFDFITDIPQTLKEGWNFSFNTKPNTLLAWGGIISSSVVLYIYDEKIYKHAKILGRSLGLGNDDHTKPMIRVHGFNIFRGPTDAGSTMEFVGDGWLQVFTATSFVINGSINNDNRAMQTGSQIMNSLVSASIPTQIIKRATGREDPNRTTRYRGRWKPFDKGYNKDLSAHDAVPSGHMMAATSTLTVIDSNYPEYKSFIRPVGITLLTLLGYQMVNVGVHWASDYPLAIGLGYAFGRVASTYGKKEKESSANNDWQILPIYSASSEQRTYGAVAIINF